MEILYPYELDRQLGGISRIELLCRTWALNRTTTKAIYTVTVDLLAYAMTSEFAATWLPAVFVPLIGLVTPAVFIVLVGRHITATD